MSSNAVPVKDPPWSLVKHELEMYNRLKPAPPTLPATLPNSGADIKTILADAQRQSQQNAADFLLGKRSTLPGFSVPALSSPVLGSLKPLNGGPAAWSGVVAGVPQPQRMQLPAVAQPFGLAVKPGGGGLPKSTYFDSEKTIVAWWDDAKWVAKGVGRFLGAVGAAMTARDIYQWARRYWPKDDYKMPDRVKTQYIITTASLLYEHPGGYWKEYPPPGYGPGGARMW